MTADLFSLTEYSTGRVITGRARWVMVMIPAADMVVMILVLLNFLLQIYGLEIFKHHQIQFILEEFL